MTKLTINTHKSYPFVIPETSSKSARSRANFVYQTTI